MKSIHWSEETQNQRSHHFASIVISGTSVTILLSYYIGHSFVNRDTVRVYSVNYLQYFYLLSYFNREYALQLYPIYTYLPFSCINFHLIIPTLTPVSLPTFICLVHRKVLLTRKTPTSNKWYDTKESKDPRQGSRVRCHTICLLRETYLIRFCIDLGSFYWEVVPT